MRKIEKTAAEDALERLSLGALNRALSGYWLSLWRGDELPRYEDFKSDTIRALMPNVVLFDVIPDHSVVVGDAGADICAMHRMPMQGLDWIEFAAARNRRLRGRNFNKIVHGGIMLCRRRLTMAARAPVYNEELSLPFAADAGGVSRVISHVDWREATPVRFTGIVEMEKSAHDHRILPLQKSRRGGKTDFL